MGNARNLVVLRCGDNSLHPAWLSPNKSWDLAISYFGSVNESIFPEAIAVHRYKGGKWDGIYSFFADNPSLLDSYDFIWLPDDDIMATSDDINRIFEFVSTHQLELAQPSLSKHSFLSHIITLNNPAFAYRHVNFVEVMVPVLSQKLLKKVLPLFEHLRSGWGLDFMWHRFTSNPSKSVAIIDSVQVTHTRPVGGALKKMMSTEGMTSPEEEQRHFLETYGEFNTTTMTLGGLLRTGISLEGRAISSVVAAVGWVSRPRGVKLGGQPVRRTLFIRSVLWELYNTLIRPSPLNTIDPINPNV